MRAVCCPDKPAHAAGSVWCAKHVKHLTRERAPLMTSSDVKYFVAGSILTGLVCVLLLYLNT